MHVPNWAEVTPTTGVSPTSLGLTSSQRREPGSKKNKAGLHPQGSWRAPVAGAMARGSSHASSFKVPLPRMVPAPSKCPPQKKNKRQKSKTPANSCPCTLEAMQFDSSAYSHQTAHHPAAPKIAASQSLGCHREINECRALLLVEILPHHVPWAAFFHLFQHFFHSFLLSFLLPMARDNQSFTT